MNTPSRITFIRESTWRAAASRHRELVWELLLPGLTSIDHPLNSGHAKTKPPEVEWTALDPQNPIFNFLIEYYGLKGSKGPRRLARWSPGLDLLEAGSDGILLENASLDDIGGTLHLRGVSFHDNGVIYSPSQFYGKGDASRSHEAIRAADGYLWYRSVLHQTSQAEPVLYCHGLHEWAMVYHPEGAPPPPSAKYQSHLPVRVDRETIVQAVERKGVQCTHIDAIRFFAPAAGPWSANGINMKRSDQLRLEQPACVHAQMDLLKIAMKLVPFCDADTVRQCLEVALAARRLDIAASPYDASEYGIEAIPVENSEGRAKYRVEQMSLMRRADPIRQKLLGAYDTFLSHAFNDEVIEVAQKLGLERRGGVPECSQTLLQ